MQSLASSHDGVKNASDLIGIFCSLFYSKKCQQKVPAKSATDIEGVIS